MRKRDDVYSVGMMEGMEMANKPRSGFTPGAVKGYRKLDWTLAKVDVTFRGANPLPRTPSSDIRTTADTLRV